MIAHYREMRKGSSDDTGNGSTSKSKNQHTTKHRPNDLLWSTAWATTVRESVHSPTILEALSNSFRVSHLGQLGRDLFNPYEQGVETSLHDQCEGSNEDEVRDSFDFSAEAVESVALANVLKVPAKRPKRRLFSVKRVPVPTPVQATAPQVATTPNDRIMAPSNMHSSGLLSGLTSEGKSGRLRSDSVDSASSVETWDEDTQTPSMSSEAICAICLKPTATSSPTLDCNHHVHMSCNGIISKHDWHGSPGSLGRTSFGSHMSFHSRRASCSRNCKLCSLKRPPRGAARTPIVTCIEPPGSLVTEEEANDEAALLTPPMYTSPRSPRWTGRSYNPRASTTSSFYEPPPYCAPLTPHVVSIPLQLQVDSVKSAIAMPARRQNVRVGCFLTAGADRGVFSRAQYRSTVEDRNLAASIHRNFLTRTKQSGFEMSTHDLGGFRLKSTFAMSLDGTSWRPIVAYLFHNTMVVTESSAGNTALTPTMLLDLVSELDSVSLATKARGALCIQFNVHSRTNSRMYFSNSHEATLYAWVSALHNPTLHFPQDPARQLSPAIGHDFVERTPVNLVVCLPSSVPLAVLAPLVGHMGSFDSVGVVTYQSSTKIVRYSPERAAWPGWKDLLELPPQPLEHSTGPTDLTDALSVCQSLALLRDSTVSTSSVLLVATSNVKLDKVPGYLLESKVPITTVTVGDTPDSSLLSRVAQETGASFSFVPDLSELEKRLTSLALYERSYTHSNLKFKLRSRLGKIVRICGYGRGPGSASDWPDTDLDNLEKSASGDYEVDLGSLHAGEERSLFVEVEVDSRMLDYVIEGSGLELVHCTATAQNMLNPDGVEIQGLATIQVNYTSSDDLNGSLPSNGLSETWKLDDPQFLESLMPTTNFSAMLRAISLGAAQIYETFLFLQATGEPSSLRTLARSAVMATRALFSHLVALESGNRQGRMQVTEPYERAKLLCHVLSQDMLLQSQPESDGSSSMYAAEMREKVWVLRAGAALSRRTPLEAVFFDQREINVL